MKIFLAWSGDRSRRVANALKEWLEDLLDDTVCWESEYDIESGAYWHNEILKAVEESKAGILCLTSDMFDAPWVMFEAGALWAGFRKRHVVPFLLDILPSSLDGLNYPLFPSEAEYFHRKSVLKMVKTLNNLLPKRYRMQPSSLQKRFAKSWPRLQQKLSNVSKERDLPYNLIEYSKLKLQKVMRYRCLSTTFVSSQVSELPFSIVDLLSKSSKRVLFAGQNLYTLAGKGEKQLELNHKNAVFNALRSGKQVDIMLCDIRCSESAYTWGKGVMNNLNLFKQHLRYSTRIFKKWAEEARRSSLNGLTLKKIKMVPLSITFVDPNVDAKGLLVITNSVYERKEPTARPCYLIFNRVHPDVFNYYWNAYEWAFGQLATPIV